jgi:hypothetical protein
MANFPKKVSVGHVRYTVRIEKGLASIAGASGTCGEDMQLILIDDQLGPDQERETVLHELMHAIVHATGHRKALEEVDKNFEELLVYSMSVRLIELLRDNPKLVEYLVS